MNIRLSLFIGALFCTSAIAQIRDPNLPKCAADNCRDVIPPQGNSGLGPKARLLRSKDDNVAHPSARPKIPGDAPLSEDLLPTPPKKPLSKKGSGQNRGAGTNLLNDPYEEEVPVSACLAKLQKISVAEIADQPKTSDQACTIPDPVLLVSTNSPGKIYFTSGLTLDCEFASAVAEFVANTVQPLAKFHIGEPLVQLHTGQGFVCRRRNNTATGKLSEHSFGNAIDLTGFEFASGRRLPIGTSAKMKREEAVFFKALRKAACGTFTTVLGPGSSAAHAAHLHLDLARANDKKNPYRICE